MNDWCSICGCMVMFVCVFYDSVETVVPSKVIGQFVKLDLACNSTNPTQYMFSAKNWCMASSWTLTEWNPPFFFIISDLYRGNYLSAYRRCTIFVVVQQTVEHFVRYREIFEAWLFLADRRVAHSQTALFRQISVCCSLTVKINPMLRLFIVCTLYLKQLLI